MKKFFKKLVGRGENKDSAASARKSKEETKEPEPRQQGPPCEGDKHRDLVFKCFNDTCQEKLCTSCAPPMNKKGEILCKLCTLSAMNLNNDSGDGMAFGGTGSTDEEDNFGGSGMRQSAHVSFDKHSSQVVGWDSIWAIIDGEEQEKKSL